MTTHILTWTTPTGRTKKIVTEMRGRIRDIVADAPCEHQGSNYNGYGYQDHDYTYILTPEQAKSVRAIINEKKKKAPKKIKTEEEKIQDWCKRLDKLTNCGIDTARVIANQKIEYKENRIDAMEDRQSDHYSIKREQLIRKMERENPLRRITGTDHAEAILYSHHRHNNTDYEDKLEEGRELAMLGDIDRENIKEYARAHMQ